MFICHFVCPHVRPQHTVTTLWRRDWRFHGRSPLPLSLESFRIKILSVFLFSTWQNPFTFCVINSLFEDYWNAVVTQRGIKEGVAAIIPLLFPLPELLQTIQSRSVWRRPGVTWGFAFSFSLSFGACRECSSIFKMFPDLVQNDHSQWPLMDNFKSWSFTSLNNTEYKPSFRLVLMETIYISYEIS